MWQTLETSKQFFAGDYQEVLALGDQGAELPVGVHVASLVFLGKILQAELVLKRLRKLDGLGAQLSMAEYFLGVGYVRQSRYDDARLVFARLGFSKRNSIDPTEKFFAICAVAFFRYYSGRYRQSLALGERALVYAQEAKFVYGEILASDIVANSAVSSGEIRKGLRFFKTALDSARGLHGSSFESALTISLTVNQSVVSTQAERSIAKLRALKKRKLTNTYSNAEINLEIIRQYTLIGQSKAAHQLLEETYDLVHQNNNRRQAATLNLRSGYLQFLEGNLSQALHLVRMAKNLLHISVDLLAQAQLTGLELEILNHLSSNRPPVAASPGLNQLQSAINHRISRRTSMSRPVDSSKPEKQVGKTGEDSLGDLMDQLKFVLSPKLIREVINSGHLTLLRKPLGTLPGANSIYFGISPEIVLLVNGAEMRTVTGISRSQRKILVALSGGEKTKQDLITDIWKYEYHPIRHDGLVYSAIQSLRKRLDVNWIELTESGYRLSAQVKVVEISLSEKAIEVYNPNNQLNVSRKDESNIAAANVHDENLNLRQNKIMDLLRSGERTEWKALDSRNLFAISTMTATRDLTQLQAQGMVRRIGKGRATYYVLTGPST